MATMDSMAALPRTIAEGHSPAQERATPRNVRSQAVIPIQSALVSGMASVYGDDWESETTPVAVPQHCRSGVVRAAPASHFRDPSSIVPLGIDIAVTISAAAAPALLSSLFPDACPLVVSARLNCGAIW